MPDSESVHDDVLIGQEGKPRKPKPKPKLSGPQAATWRGVAGRRPTVEVDGADLAVMKFNENHDPSNGEFSSTGGAGGVTMNPASVTVQNNLIKSASADWGVPEADVRKNAQAALDSTIKNSHVTIEVSFVAWDNILAGKPYQNVFDHSAGSVANSPAAVAERKQIEKNVMGIPESMPGNLRPVYGFVVPGVDKPTGGFGDFGGVKMVLKKDVNSRATWTDGDTGLNGANSTTIPTQMSKPGVESLAWNRSGMWGFDMGVSKGSQQYVTDHLTGKITSHFGADAYLEAQVYGGVKLSDVDKVIAPNGDVMYDSAVTKYNHDHGADGKFSSSGDIQTATGGHISRAEAAAVMYGTGSPQHARALAAENDRSAAVGGGGFSVDTAGMGERSNPQAALREAQVAHDAIQNATGSVMPTKVQFTAHTNMMGLLQGGAMDGVTPVAFYNPSTKGSITVDAGSASAPFFITHEYGHQLDFEKFGNGKPASSNPNSKLAGVMNAIRGSEPYGVWKYKTDGSYWASNPETFARAFSQYVATKSGNPSMLGSLAAQSRVQWTPEQFTAISAEFDKVFGGPVQKYNQNHDAKGRFSSTGGAAYTLAPKVAARLREPDGGFTFDMHTGKEARTGYALSIHPEASESIKGAHRMTDVQLQHAVMAYAGRHSDLLAKKGNMLGGWNDPTDGTVFMDVSHVVGTRAEAHKLSLEHDQRAYFDMGSGKSIEVNAGATSGGVVHKYNHTHGADGKFASAPGAGSVDMKLTVDPHAALEHEGTGTKLGDGSLQSRNVTLDTAQADVKIAQDSIANVINVDKIGDVKVVKGHMDDPSTQAWYNPRKPGQLVYNDISSSAPGMDTSDTAFSMTHEFGHLLDFEYMNVGGNVVKGGGAPGSVLWDPESARGFLHDPKIKEIAAAQKHLSSVMVHSPSVQELMYRASTGELSQDSANYFLSPPEAFARAFSQYVAVKSGKDSVLYKQMDGERQAGIIGQWEDKEFEPISHAMDGVMKAYGLDKTPVAKFNPNHDEAGKFTSGVGGAAASVHARAVAEEPGITADMKTLAAAHGAQLTGLDFRLKSKDSLQRKIASDAKAKNLSPAAAGAAISDSVRYTMVSDPKTYTPTVQGVLGDLKSKGYQTRVKNYWQTGDPYQGVNVAVTNPNGHTFELQFHTPESFDVKQNRIHADYEAFRTATSQSDRLLYWKRMVSVADAIQVPDGVLSVPELRRQAL